MTIWHPPVSGFAPIKSCSFADGVMHQMSCTKVHVVRPPFWPPNLGPSPQLRVDFTAVASEYEVTRRNDTDTDRQEENCTTSVVSTLTPQPSFRFRASIRSFYFILLVLFSSFLSGNHRLRNGEDWGPKSNLSGTKLGGGASWKEGRQGCQVVQRLAIACSDVRARA
jgi:hypothetical protein